MLSDKSDEEIIALYKSGEKEAFRYLIDRYTPSIYNFITRLVRRENASDLVQEIFIKAWKKLNSFDSSKASFKTWLFTIARNSATDFLRKHKTINFSDLITDEQEDSFIETILDENPLPDEALQKLQDTEILNKLLEKLPVNYKAVLILHYQEEMTFLEIGEALEKPLNTVKSWHQRAIFILKKNLET